MPCGRKEMGQSEGGAEVNEGSVNPRGTEGLKWPFKLVSEWLCAPMSISYWVSLGMTWTGQLPDGSPGYIY